MNKELHAVGFDGMTFGMAVDTSTEAWKNFKKAVKWEDCMNCFGDGIIQDWTVPHLALAAIMREAHWLVSEKHSFNKFHIDGFKNGEDIYIKYTDEPIDFSHRR